MRACVRVSLFGAVVCSDSVTVSGAGAVQPALMGTYLKVAGLAQGSRPVYQRVGETVEYLYYWPSANDWNIGADYTTDEVELHSAGTAAACPDQATGWQVWNGDAWVSGYSVKVVQGAHIILLLILFLLRALSCPLE
jgi:hypothetical protein